MANEDDQTWLADGAESAEMARRRRLRPRMELGFARRHRIGLAGTLAVVVAVIVGTGVGLVRARIARGRTGVTEATARKNPANQPAKAATREQDEVEREARRVKAVKDFVTAMLAEADPVRSKGGVDKARLIASLDKAAAECGVKFHDDPEAEIGVHWALASAYNALGQLPQAIEQSRIAHELGEHALPHESKAYVRVAQSEIAWLLEAHRYIEMEQLAVSALETSRRVYGPVHVVTRSLWNSAVVARARQSSPEVAKMLLRDLEKVAGVDGSANGRGQPLGTPTEVASDVPRDAHLAQTPATTQPMRAAVPVIPAPVAAVVHAPVSVVPAPAAVVPVPAAVVHAAAPEAHAPVATPMPIPAPARDDGREAKAAAEAVEVRRGLLAAQLKAGGAESPASIQARVNLAQALRAAGMAEEYKRTVLELLAMARDHQEQGDERAPAVTWQIAIALRPLNERGVELAAWRIAHAVSTCAWGPQYGIDRHVQLGNCLARHGDLAEAEQVLRKARELHAQYTGRTSMQYARTTRDLANVLLATAGRRDEAEALYREAVAVAAGADEVAKWQERSPAAGVSASR